MEFSFPSFLHALLRIITGERGGGDGTAPSDPECEARLCTLREALVRVLLPGLPSRHVGVPLRGPADDRFRGQGERDGIALGII